MKNFSNATDIKSLLTLKCCLGVKRHYGDVCCVIKINNEPASGDTLGETEITEDREIWFSVSLDQPIDISIQLLNRQHPNALELSLTVNGHEVLPLYQHLANPQTNYIDFNQLWELKIPNFYSWYHTASGQGWIA